MPQLCHIAPHNSCYPESQVQTKNYLRSLHMPSKKKPRAKKSVSNGPTNTQEASETNSVLCEICGAVVKLGDGGYANLTKHQQGEPCKKRARENTVVEKTASLTKFFKPRQAQPKELETGVRPIPKLSSHRKEAGEAFSSSASARNSEAEDGEPIKKSSGWSVLKDTLALVQKLPESVPYGTEKDRGLAAGFVGDIENSDNGLAWEDADGMLNGVIGAGVKLEALTASIRRGPCGVQSLIEWIDRHIVRYHFDTDMLVGKMSRLQEALRILYVSSW